MKKLLSGAAGLVLMLLTACLPLGAQTDDELSGLPQLLYPGFSEATIIFKDGRTKKMQMNYNMASGKMVFSESGNIFDLQTPELIDTVVINGTKFVKSGNRFLELLLNAPVSLLLDHKGEIVPAGKPAGYGGTSQVSATTTVSGMSSGSAYYNLKLPPQYIIRTEKIYVLKDGDGNLSNFSTSRQFLKLFPELETQLQEFIKKNRIRFDDSSDVARLADFYNGLL
jgi:hypothetical protein